jgi:hypothetical protein
MNNIQIIELYSKFFDDDRFSARLTAYLTPRCLTFYY